eukprot:6807443-Prymnesium_polylepis.1
MAGACASTCSEHLYREQTRLRLAHNTLGFAKHARDCGGALVVLAAAFALDALRRRLRPCESSPATRTPPAVGVPALPCALVTTYFFVEAACGLQSRRAYWEWLNPDWRDGKTELHGIDLRVASSVVVLPAVCVVWLWRRHTAVLAATCMAILTADLVAITLVDASHHYVQSLALDAMVAGGSGSVVYSAAQLTQRRVRLVAEGEFVVKRVSLLGCLIACLAAHLSHISRAIDRLPEHTGSRGPPPHEAIAIAVGRMLIGAPFVVAGAAELCELCLSEQLPFPRDDAHNVMWPKAVMLTLCVPLTLGLGPFRDIARTLGVLCVLEAVTQWSAPEATVVTWLEAATPNTLSYKEAFNEAMHHRRHFGLLLAVSGGFSLLHTVGAGGYTLGGLLKKRA